MRPKAMVSAVAAVAVVAGESAEQYLKQYKKGSSGGPFTGIQYTSGQILIFYKYNHRRWGWGGGYYPRP